MSDLRSKLLLPLYIGLITFALIAVIFLADQKTPKAVFIILLLAYIGLLIFCWRQHFRKPQQTQIRDLSENRYSKDKPAALCRFEAQAQSILRQINMQKSEQKNQISYYSPYYQQIKYPSSLRQLPIPVHESPEDSNIFGTFNTQTWKDQFRQALEQFKKNLNSQIRNQQTYKSVLERLNLKKECVSEAEQIISSLLLDRASQYCSYALKAVQEVNKILARNFGLNLTKVESTNSKQINIDEYKRLVEYYRNNRSLPTNYKGMVVPASQKMYGQAGYNFERSSVSKLQSDMSTLSSYQEVLQQISYYPLERFSPALFFYILRAEFATEIIKINNTDTSNQRKRQISDSRYSGRQKQIINFLLQLDNSISLASYPQFRTKNCLKICLIFILLLLKKNTNNAHPILRSIRRYIK